MGNTVIHKSTIHKSITTMVCNTWAASLGNLGIMHTIERKRISIGTISSFDTVQVLVARDDAVMIKLKYGAFKNILNA